MRGALTFVGFLIILLAAALTGLDAQSGFDRLVGPDEFGNPIVINAVDGRTLGLFARAARVPMGVELAPGKSGRKRTPVTLTGMQVGKALQVIADFDDRYEMREVDRVFILRTREAWVWPDHPLHSTVSPVHLRDIRGRNALSLIAAFLGAPHYQETYLSDTKRFSLELDAGTVLDLLNESVRAHGEMAWSFERRTGSPFEYTVMLYSGGTGTGCGVPGSAPKQPVQVALYADIPPSAGSRAVLERIVGNAPDGSLLTLNGPYPSAIQRLADVMKVPMGIEFLGPADPPLTGRVPASGRTLREVLDAMIAVDPRYEWREMDGVIVVRPPASWNDPGSLFFRLVPPVQLSDVSPQEAIERLARQLGHPGRLGPIASGRLISVDQPQGTVLDLLNAILRAHGELTWELVPETHADALREGFRHTLTFWTMGGSGYGFAVR